MTDIGSIGKSALEQYAPKQEEIKHKNELGKNEFLNLMIAQLNNQSPLEPQDNTAFVAQLAQFSSLEGITELNNSVGDIAGEFRSAQALQASAMVGRSVLVPVGSGTLPLGGTISGVADVPEGSGKLTMKVYTQSGALVSQSDLGQNQVGEVKFTWDGKNSNGEPMPAGSYRVEVEGYFDGKPEQVKSFLGANVDSVSIAADGGVKLNLAGQGSIAMSEVRQIF
ncbi:flagellar hook assembly protein FlgD [Allohahella marinimesophila]|uniref:Basal-body rod modification protein FlgD n=1 Tax=Allohahella marinimesophila TaxID=1054972 RepID=A0ABP7NTJ7_9GAMM